MTGAHDTGTASDALDVALAFGTEPDARPPQRRAPAAAAEPGDALDVPAFVGARDARAPRPGTARMPWAEARRIAAAAARPAAAGTAPLAAALGRTLAEPLTAATDLPAFDTSAMDGWAVSGPGPWRIADGPGITAGDVPGPLPEGHAVRIATGARVPAAATAVLRREAAREDGARLRTAGAEPEPGRDIRPRGAECRRGEELLAAGRPVTPAVLGLAASAGCDTLAVRPVPAVALLVLGDELLDAGPPRDGRVRDALGPLLAAWLPALGAAPAAPAPVRVPDDREALRAAVAGAPSDILLTTGGTAAGPRDYLHPVLADLGAELLVDGVDVRPGHPMLLARIPGGEGAVPRHLVGLPGNPLAAVAAVLTLAAPLLAARAGRTPTAEDPRAPLAAPVPPGSAGTRLVPAVHTVAGLRPLRYDGPAMLRSLAAADTLAVVPGDGAAAGAEVAHLPLHWPAAA